MPGLSKQFATLVYIAVPIAKPKFQAFFKSSNENEKSEIQLSFVFKWLPGFSESFWLHCASFSQGLALFFLPDASVWLQLLPHYYLHTILQAILGYCLVLQATNDDAFKNKNKHKAFKLSNQTPSGQPGAFFNFLNGSMLSKRKFLRWFSQTGFLTDEKCTYWFVVLIKGHKGWVLYLLNSKGNLLIMAMGSPALGTQLSLVTAWKINESHTEICWSIYSG